MKKRYMWFEQRRQEFVAMHKHDKNRAKVNTNEFIKYIKSKMKPELWDKYKHILDQKEANLPHHRQGNYNPEKARKARANFGLKRYEFMYGPLKCKHCGAVDGPLFTKLRNSGCIRILVRHNYCSDSCSKKSKEAYDKRVKTVMEKYGTDNVSRAPEIVEKLRKINSDPEVIAKKKAKTKQTIIKKYGSLESFYKKQVIKRLPTVQKRYGGNAATCSKKVRNKVKASLIKHYGVDNPMHCPAIVEKLKRTQCYKHKTIKIENKIFRDLQGNEPFFLKWFLNNAKHYGLEDIFTSCLYIRYKWQGKSHLYYPDFIIPKDGIVIEVKSDYTIGYKGTGSVYCYDKNYQKSKAVIKNGFKYLMAVCFPEKNKVFLWKGKLPSVEEFTKNITTWKEQNL